MRRVNLFSKIKEELRFELTGADVDCCPDDLNEQLPFTIWWNVPGSYNGSKGTWELLVDPSKNQILHWLYQSK